jgi:hypothetical protein
VVVPEGAVVVVVVEVLVVDVVVVDVVVVPESSANARGAVNHDWPPLIWNWTTMSHWCVESHVNACVSLNTSVQAAPVPIPTWKPSSRLADVSLGPTATNFCTSASGETWFGEQNGPSRANEAVSPIEASWAHKCTRISDTLPAANVALTATD